MLFYALVKWFKFFFNVNILSFSTYVSFPTSNKISVSTGNAKSLTDHHQNGDDDSSHIQSEVQFTPTTISTSTPSTTTTSLTTMTTTTMIPSTTTLTTTMSTTTTTHLVINKDELSKSSTSPSLPNR